MADVKMTYTAMEENANKVQQHKEEFDSMITGMTNVIATLRGSWKGPAMTAFETAFEEVRPKLNNLSTLLGNFKTELQQAAADTQEQQAASAQRIGTNLSLE